MAAETAFRASVIIPSHNRRQRLIATIDAISGQGFALGAVELIVIADGCRDDTVAAVREYPAPFALRVVELPGCGPAVAPNRGAEPARAQ